MANHEAGIFNGRESEFMLVDRLIVMWGGREGRCLGSGSFETVAPLFVWRRRRYPWMETKMRPASIALC